MRVGYNIGPLGNKGCNALTNAMKKLVRLASPEAEIEPYTSGYTDKKFDVFLCIGGDNITYNKSLEFDVTRNAIANGIPTFGFGSDVSPVLGKYTSVPLNLLRILCRMDELLVRSSGSQRLLESYEIPSIKIPDLAWCLEAEPIEFSVPENTIAISIYQNVDNIKSMFNALLLELKARGYNVLTHTETAWAPEFEGITTTPRQATWEQNITILSKCKALITTGFHAAICGHKAGIPVLVLPVQEKTYWLQEELGLPVPIPFSSLQVPAYVCMELEKLIAEPPKITIPSHTKTIELLKDLFGKYTEM